MAFRNEIFEKNAIFLLIGTLLTVAVGGIIEVVPVFTVETTVEKVQGMRPYSPLEQRGRDIYVREGCYLCHSQQIRTLRDEVERYGHYSIAAESMYDHPFQWGSKRMGSDLARVGGKYSNDIQERMATLRKLSVPYTDEQIANAKADLKTQADPAADTEALLKRYPKTVAASGSGREVTEADALVAYLQMLGTLVNFADTNTERLRQ